jgi:hypothetical protein
VAQLQKEILAYIDRQQVKTVKPGAKQEKD